MIIREWRGRAQGERAEDYPQHFHEKVVPELRRIPGFAGAYVCRRHLPGGEVEFLVLTRWHSMDAVRGFTGPNIDTAVVEPGAAAALSQYDRNVQHYEMIEQVLPPLG